MNEVFVRVVVRRFLECTLVNIGLSAFLTMIFAAEFVSSSQTTICVGLTIGAAVYMLLNINMLSHCYLDMSDEPDANIYIKSNILAYAIFAVINLVIYFIANSEIYTWMFAVTKFARYMPFGINTLVSALLFHIVMFAVIALVPLRMKRIITQGTVNDDENDYYMQNVSIDAFEASEEPVQKKKMIKHVLSFKLKDSSKKNIERAAEVLLSMRDKVPMIRDIQVGCDFLHSDRSYDICLIVTLDSPEALEEYQQDKYHVEVVKKHMHEVVEKSVAVDFEI